MKTLYIDTHYLDITIALFNDESLVRKEVIKDKKNNSEFIFPSIVKVLNDEKIDEVIVINGPGSFTGVRLGVTIAKTFAYCLNIPLKMISTLKAIAISNDVLNVAVSDSNGYFIGSFDDNYNEKEEYSYIDEEEFNKQDYLIDGEIDCEKVIKYSKNINAINPHEAKPLYVKKIGVEIDKTSK